MADRRIAIGIDVGGSGIKAAAVDVSTGEIVGERHRVLTPQPSTPAAVVAVIARLVARVGREARASAAPVGVGFPSVVIDGVTKTAANVDARLDRLRRGVRVDRGDRTRRRRLQRCRRRRPRGDALRRGRRDPRHGVRADPRHRPRFRLVQQRHARPEHRARPHGDPRPRCRAAVGRHRPGPARPLWKAWAADLDEHLLAIDRLFWPSLFILGGGVSKNADQFVPRLTVRPPVVPAKLRNDAGIVGAAMAAAEAGCRDLSRRTRWPPRLRRARAGGGACPTYPTRSAPPRPRGRGRRAGSARSRAGRGRSRAGDPLRASAPTVSPGERPVGRHLDLLHREGQLAVGQRGVDEVGDARADGELRDLTAGHRVRGDDRSAPACSSLPPSPPRSPAAR